MLRNLVYENQTVIKVLQALRHKRSNSDSQLKAIWDQARFLNVDWQRSLWLCKKVFGSSCKNFRSVRDIEWMRDTTEFVEK